LNLDAAPELSWNSPSRFYMMEGDVYKLGTVCQHEDLVLFRLVFENALNVEDIASFDADFEKSNQNRPTYSGLRRDGRTRSG
jgi:hypothetical protein